mmetsp:Transcript_20456/g.36720  ORF Transcript_20456/g.36720 Transcript_20456/m.36720 type:complete len:630 (-) Transcript_20456:42-1931(-)|eukprot:CAMPEP_0197652662 /NCGR_PEP_ID=MMETSP1338-20131121/34583_1 /TAXON_ID=43686 ORGANISM="Pelagodinium beii, Strain RCC1491" /NCGR_SAMPLE_ID=MMETSP1338 /ASSEMBLY_ACC=CAM_ASM_000754 /LENGTH=629 /DNA_ID=CAMNT_0043227589 /DNA_START=43 /DNA_END=1932 /DNA_ORIENTATION=-
MIAGASKLGLAASCSCALLLLCRAGSPGHFGTTEAAVRSFSWTAREYTAAEALNLTFPDGSGWQDLEFSEASGSTVTLELLATWIENELLSSDAFANDSAPVPWPSKDGLQDQLAPGEWVAYSRRQVCYIAAQSLLGANTHGYENGLLRFLANSPGWSTCTPRTGDFGKSLFTLLAACSVDPGLREGGQGPTLIVAKARGAESMSGLRNASSTADLGHAGLRICQYDDGLSQALSDVNTVPAEGCQQPNSAGPGADFMTGGKEHVKGQAIQDISASFIGGYIYGNACGLGGGQDERLLVYMPEVTVLTYFLSEDAETPQLRVPAWILGARMFFIGLDGTGRFDHKLKPNLDVPLTGDVVAVELAGENVSISSSRPFIAFMSESQGFLGTPEDLYGEEVLRARRNKLQSQREINASSNFSFAQQVRAWYTGVALSSYHVDVQPVLKQLVRSIGAGPWLAGLWWGDSQLGLLAMWIGQAMAAATWGDEPFNLDYYLYSAFTENAGNQCFVHSKENCKSCMQHCLDSPLPESAYWLPDWALMRNGTEKACAGFEEDCGENGIEHMIANFKSEAADTLWQAVEDALSRSNGDTNQSVFDLLLESSVDEFSGGKHTCLSCILSVGLAVYLGHFT